MENWSLQAIVRQSRGDHLTKFFDMDNEDQKPDVEFPSIDHEFFSSYPEFFDISVCSSDELEELYKPFYPGVHIHLPTHQKIGSEFHKNRPENDVEDKPANEPDLSPGTSDCAAKLNGAYTPKYKKRKNQQKRVMIQVSAEGLSSDMWAWRKYGQKPIKGSPYPRSYYRCSSSKGCLARKQVEQSCTDPGMFIVTYTAEHSHSQPTRRNSLAGTIRQKFPHPKSPNHAAKQVSNSDATVLSPKILIQASSDEDLIRVKQETKEDDHTLPVSADSCIEDDTNELGISDSMFNDEFFSGLDFLDGFGLDRVSCKSL